MEKQHFSAVFALLTLTPGPSPKGRGENFRTRSNNGLPRLIAFSRAAEETSMPIASAMAALASRAASASLGLLA